MGGRRRSIGWGWLCAAVLLFACGKSYNAGLLEKPAETSDGHAGHGAADAAAPRADAGDAALPNGSGGRHAGGSGGSGAMMGTGGTGQSQGECVIDPIADACKVRCPETCNNEDDDCDGKIDEDTKAACKADQAVATCTSGECRIAECTGGYRDCNDDPDDGCEVAPDDVLNCGSCGHACELLNAIAACQKDKCVAIGCDGVYDDCDKNKNDCETAANTLKNCGKCGLTCADADVANASASCELGFCGVGQCYMGFGDCNQTPGDGCEQTLDSNQNCGACNKPCDLKGSDDDCGTGVCLAQSCQSGYDNCDGNPANGCESLGTSDDCGGCGKTCNGTLANVTGAQCKSQACALDCAALYADCDDDPGTGCETPINTPDRCGACDKPCAINNAEVSCETGTCTFVRCNQGWGDCNDDRSPADGCETPLDTLQHCNACDKTCDKASCSGGVCTAADCTTPPHDDDCGSTGHCGNCDGNDADCEANLNGDKNNCSTCGHQCVFNSGVNMPNATLSCASAACKANCTTGFDDCNQNYRDGCETPLNTLQNCGTCGTGCSIANATPTCSTRACLVQTCASDWADCNNDKTSCETQLGTTANCTGCGQACALPNAVPSCAGSAGAHSCAISSCTQSYYADCDATPGNGCEIDKRSSTANCGNCGNNCAMHAHVQSASCGSGVCNYTCASGFGNCTSAAGCETPLTTLTDCASCGTTCARQNGSASCSTGSCQLTGCNSGYQNCDGNAGNGCEPLTTLSNCGACNQPCSVVNGSATCATQTCQIASCNADWDDCDTSPNNGCERNIKPPASGGLGPCLPDTNCTHQTYNGRDYYVCTTDRSFSDARAHCQLQLLGELVHIDDTNENAFVLGAIGADAWIGGSDVAVEGRWRWANDDAQFWMGAASGTGTGFTNWNSGEPNDNNGNEDCMVMYKASGKWNDGTCTDVHDFVCEVQPDLCPGDPNKANPGQCGCGTADTDTDGDGTANCNDACPSDSGKVAPGQCGCGNADTDDDTDGTANCVDACPADKNKIAVGQCGCGNADTDSDNDGTANCNDACPFDDTRTTAPCAFSYTPTNFNQTTLNFGSAPTTTLDCQATTTVDTSTTPATITNWCGTAPTPVVQTQSGGPDVVILPLQGFTLAATRTLRVIGTRPLILAVRGNVTINGTINARGVGGTAGAGGNQSCASAGNGVNGQNDGGGDAGGGGGGGAGFGANGAGGGTGNDSYSNGGSGGGGGAAAGAAALAPLRGGCKGGNGGNGNGTGGSGGGGGGAFQISSSGTLALASTAIISASGGGGLPGNNDEDGGGGGGSGGGLFLEAGSISIASGAWVTANGGAGAGGNETDSPNGGPGTDGFANNTARAPGGPADQGGGGGGDGGASAGGATGGGNGVMKFVFFGGGGAGGGGGGGVGRIRVHGVTSCALSGTFSPGASQACP